MDEIGLILCCNKSQSVKKAFLSDLFNEISQMPANTTES